MPNEDFWSKIASLVSSSQIVVDRPEGSVHPHQPDVRYPLDYGYLTGTVSGDGHGVDVWIGTLKSRGVTGVVCTVDSGKRDVELKILIGCSKAERRRILAFHNYGNQAAVLVERGAE